MKRSILFMMASIFLCVACGKSGDPEPKEDTKPDEKVDQEFDVKLTTTTYKVGDEVTFDFSGKEVDDITFYSGEFLHEYQYSQTDRITRSNSAVVSFRTNLTYGAQADQLAVFVSTDYNGSGNFADVATANWKGKEDFNPWFTLAPEDNTWGDPNRVLSGDIDLREAFEEGKPLYVGFRYRYDPNVTGGPRAWHAYLFKAITSIRHPDENGDLADYTTTLYDNYLDFALIYQNEAIRTVHEGMSDPSTKITASGSYVKLYMTSAQVTNAEISDPTEIWAISPALNLEEYNYGLDMPKEVVKESTDVMPKDFKYVFMEPGKYTVSFVWKDGEEEKVKNFEVTVNE